MGTVTALPVRIITYKTPGVKPLDGELEGQWLVLSPNRLKERYRFPHNQVVKATGGFGCSPTKSGRAVFVEHLDGEHARWDRGDFIGIASPELVESAKADTSTVAPIDLTLRNYLAIGPGTYAHGETIAEACKKAGVRFGTKKCLAVYRCHPEAYVNDMGGVMYPTGTTLEEIK